MARIYATIEVAAIRALHYLKGRRVSSKRKYAASIDATDVWEALISLGTEAHALISMELRRSVVTPGLIIVKVNYHDPLAVADVGPVYVFQETLSVVRKVDLANYLHRVLWDSWSGYHNSPWQWTRGMRKANTGG